MAKNLLTAASGLAFDVIEKTSSGLTESQPFQSNLIGHYNVSNLLGVIAVMRSLDVPLAHCIQACASLTSVPGRLAIVSKPTEPLTVIDYAHTPDALEKVLIALREVSTIRGGKLWCVFGCGGNRDTTKRPMMGAIAQQYADHPVVTSDNPRDENPSTIVSQILLGMLGISSVKGEASGEDNRVQVQVDRALAISETIAQAQASDVIVIAGKGHEDFQEIAGVKTTFSDQTHARAALAAWRAKP